MHNPGKSCYTRQLRLCFWHFDSQIYGSFYEISNRELARIMRNGKQFGNPQLHTKHEKMISQHQINIFGTQSFYGDFYWHENLKVEKTPL